MWNRCKSLLLTKLLTVLITGLLIAAAFFLPSAVQNYFLFTGKEAEFYIPLLTLLYVSLVPAGTLLVCLYLLLQNLGTGSVFIHVNVLYLRIISWCCFAVAGLFGVFGFFYLFSIFITGAAGFFGLILRVIKNVFEHAIELKSENDLTI